MTLLQLTPAPHRLPKALDAKTLFESQEEEKTGLFPQISSPACGRSPSSGPS